MMRTERTGAVVCEELPLDVLKGFYQHALDVCVAIPPEAIVGDDINTVQHVLVYILGRVCGINAFRLCVLLCIVTGL